MLTIAGKKMDETAKNKPKLDGYFVILEKWSKSKILASRIRFMLRDVLDLRKTKWKPRRENVQVLSSWPDLIPGVAWLGLARPGLNAGDA
jgi:translation initiation factor 4G